ncbi:copper chaperone PCu(A)C [Aureimonas sp. SK2]|uniref:copper chaperone PCu(A)C n=1 Tax=Aureimonas sp. SK2 TaxID=3015992 RepID=UPI0024439699|nr:copper chaperone PCu(A)C [Aureimonas sp. SK2]
MDLIRDDRAMDAPQPPSLSRAVQSLFAASIALGLMTIVAEAHEFKIGDLTIDHPWSRQTPPMAPVGVAYLTIKNDGAETDRLIGGSAERSEGFELHTSENRDGVARMRRLKDGVAIGPGETIELKPLGTHIMLTGLTAPIKAGETFAGTLVFERAGTLDVEFAVQGPGAPAPQRDGHEEHSR